MASYRIFFESATPKEKIPDQGDYGCYHVYGIKKLSMENCVHIPYYRLASHFHQSDSNLIPLPFTFHNSIHYAAIMVLLKKLEDYFLLLLQIFQ